MLCVNPADQCPQCNMMTHQAKLPLISVCQEHTNKLILVTNSCYLNKESVDPYTLGRAENLLFQKMYVYQVDLYVGHKNNAY